MTALIAIFSTTFALVGAVEDPPRPEPMAPAVASFYDYGGASDGACGALRADGVANRTMACGTRLVMCAARCAPATVDDRGPYVGGRDFDLSTSLARAMGFDFVRGVQTIRWRRGR